MDGRARPGRRRTATAVGVGGLLLLAALIATALAPDGARLPESPGPAAGEVDLDADPDRTAARAPEDAPWSTEDGAPGRDDDPLDPDQGGPAPSTRASRAVPLDDTGWRVELGSASVAATGDAAVVVTGTRDGVVHALDADTGARRWASDLGTPAAQLLLHDEVVVVRHTGGQASVLDRGNGALLWRRVPGGEEDRVLAIGAHQDTAILVLGVPDHPRLLAAGLRDGSRRWERSLSHDWVADAQGVVHPFGVVDGRLTSFDVGSGDVGWQVRIGPDERPVELVDEFVLVRGSNGYLWIGASAGEAVFRSSTRLGSWLAHPDGGLVLASAGATSLLLSVDAEGEERWRTSLPRSAGRQACCIELASTVTGAVLATDRRGPEPIVRLLGSGDGEVVADLSDLEDVAEREVLTVTATTAVVVGAVGTLGIDRETGDPRWRVPARTQLLSVDPVLLATVHGDGRGDGRGAGPSGSLLAPP